MLNEVTARNDYVGNGSTTAFAYTFRALLKTDIEVMSDGVVKVVDTDYTVSGLGASGGGTVTYVVAPVTGVKVALIRKQKIEQQSDYVPNEANPAERIEKDLDKLAMIAQMFHERFRRALLFAKKSLKVDEVVDDPTVGKFLRAKDPGPGFDWATPTAGGALTSPVAIGDGGTGATTAAAARTALDVPSNAESILDTIVDAKGDLIVGTAADTVARKAVGANGKFLKADSAQADGLLWDDAPALGAANRVLGMNAAATATEYKTVTGNGIAVAHTANDVALRPSPTRVLNNVNTAETTTSTTYTDLATAGPSATITPGRTTDQIIFVKATMFNGTAVSVSYMSVAIAGAGAADIDGIAATSSVANDRYDVSGISLPLGVASGSTHTAKYRVNAGTGNFSGRRIGAFTLD